MKSHEYHLNARKTAALMISPMLVTAFTGVLWHLLSWSAVLPAPWPMLDMDRTILLHQAWAACQQHKARVLFVGDSSCLMNVDARRLTTELAKPALNLATFSYLDLASHAHLASRFAQTNPGQLETVVLLLHPQTLRLGEPSIHHAALLRTALGLKTTDDSYDPTIKPTSLRSWMQRVDPLAIDLVRERLTGRLIPTPLPGQYGRLYGFTHNLWMELTIQEGSLVDPHTFSPGKTRASTEYRIASRFQKEAKRFRQICPANVRLVVGLTPTPASLTHPDTARVYREIIESLGQWLEADVLLRGLPPIMPDQKFATLTHLNAHGRQDFTKFLIAELSSEFRGIGSRPRSSLSP